jgi:hypothetical protein
MAASARHFIFDIVKLVVIQTRPKIDHGNPFPTHSEVRWCVVEIFFTMRDNSLSGARPSSVTSAIHIYGK